MYYFGQSERGINLLPCYLNINKWPFLKQERLGSFFFYCIKRKPSFIKMMVTTEFLPIIYIIQME